MTTWQVLALLVGLPALVAAELWWPPSIPETLCRGPGTGRGRS